MVTVDGELGLIKAESTGFYAQLSKKCLILTVFKGFDGFTTYQLIKRVFAGDLLATKMIMIANKHS